MRRLFLGCCGALAGCLIELDVGPASEVDPRPGRGRALDAGLAVSQVAAGSDHVCALVGGAVWCWGANARGQLGSATAGARRDEGDAVQVALDGPVARVVAGAASTCVIGPAGGVRCWGDGSPAIVSIEGLAASDLCAGDGFFCAVGSSAAVMCWGANDHGQLGGALRQDRRSPVTVPGIAGALSLACGAGHACARLADGGVRCWGADDDGQSGDARFEDHTAPVAVTGVARAVAVRAGGDFTCALSADGTLACWGNNEWAQLASGTNVARARAVVARGAGGDGACDHDLVLREAPLLALGVDHGCVLTSAGAITCWGRNRCGALGTGVASPERACVDLSRPVVGASPAAQLACGDGFCCALGRDGAVACWGRVPGAPGCAGATYVARTVALRGPL